MHNGKKIGIAIILLILIVVVIWVVYEQQKPEVVNGQNTQNIVKNQNNGMGSFVNQTLGEGTIPEGSLTEKEEEEEQEVVPPSTENSSEVIEESISDRKERAKELAEEQWGDMDGFYLNVDDRVDNEGRYTVEVRASSDTALKCTYLVNVEKGTVEEKE